jgi:hypothetical protein
MWTENCCNEVYILMREKKLDKKNVKNTRNSSVWNGIDHTSHIFVCLTVSLNLWILTKENFSRQYPGGYSFHFREVCCQDKVEYIISCESERALHHLRLKFFLIFIKYCELLMFPFLGGSSVWKSSVYCNIFICCVIMLSI